MKFSLTCLYLFSISLAAVAGTDQASQSMDAALKNARCIPDFKNGKAAGYKCFQGGVEVNSTNTENGFALKDNVITHVDGQLAKNPAEGIEAIGTKTARKITVQIDRKSVPVSEEKPGTQPARQ